MKPDLKFKNYPTDTFLKGYRLMPLWNLVYSRETLPLSGMKVSMSSLKKVTECIELLFILDGIIDFIVLFPWSGLPAKQVTGI
jgi:hypothetical protein